MYLHGKVDGVLLLHLRTEMCSHCGRRAMQTVVTSASVNVY